MTKHAAAFRAGCRPRFKAAAGIRRNSRIRAAGPVEGSGPFFLALNPGPPNSSSALVGEEEASNSCTSVSDASLANSQLG